jgi:hypothetical protein
LGIRNVGKTAVANILREAAGACFAAEKRFLLVRRFKQRASHDTTRQFHCGEWVVTRGGKGDTDGGGIGSPEDGPWC